MATGARISKGVDLAYLPTFSAGGKSSLDYYMQPVGAGLEPDGIWYGKAAQALGLEPGSVVTKEAYDRLMGDRVDPRDGVTQLGRPMPKSRIAEAQAIFEAMMEQEPHATAERQRQMRVSAAQDARVGPLYFDLTVSFSKSISVFHASLGELARRARLEGDTVTEARYAGMLAEVDAMVYESVQAGFDHFQREAGYVRTGHHGGRGPDGEPTGRTEEADLAAALWYQHTSRDEDMQLHLHTQIAHVARTHSDGKWRAPDSREYAQYVGDVAARVAAHFESAMTRRFGVAWREREDGKGREIAGIDQALMDAFSARRKSITREVARRAAQFRAQYGHAPSQRLLAQMSQDANLASRPNKKKGDLAATSDELHLRWSDTAAAEGFDLAAVALAVVGTPPPAETPGPEPSELSRAATQALAMAQREKASWKRPDLIRHLGRAMPDSVRSLTPAEAVALLDHLADRALAGEFVEVRCLERAEHLPVPEALIRADGRSVYQRHGGTRYALRSQLDAERAMLAHAGREGAPALAREDAARALGASAPDLEAQLHERAQDSGAQVTGSGLRGDQAAAVWHALTSGRTASVLIGPAGSGKTRALAEARRVWGALGPGGVIGVTPSQAAANVLRQAGVTNVMNFAEFLGHTKQARGARGIQADLPPGSLILIDEGSMFGQADMADVLAFAARAGHKVVITGDQEQLAAVEGGGGMMLLGRRLGFTQLAYPVRFRAEWERDASLRLRAGDTGVLAEYDEHGRIRGGSPESVLDQASRMFVARYLEGRDVLLMARSHEDCRELSRRIRDDLIHLGLVDGGRSAVLAEGARASAGDLIVARETDSRVSTDLPGRTLANGDVMLVEAVPGDGTLRVRLALDADRESGARRFSEGTFTLPAGHVGQAESALAVTTHSAQGRTVADGIAVVRGSEPRQWAYVAMSRAADTNTAIVVTEAPGLADPAAGSRAAPELARHRRLEREREGLEPYAEPRGRGPQREAIGVLADCLERDGTEEAALEVQRMELAHADNLSRLRVIFENETAGPRAERYRGMLAAELAAADFPARVSAGHSDRWLWRTLENAELAGLDPQQVLRDSIAQGPLDNARDVTAVIGARAAKRTAGIVPQHPQPWAEQVPEIADPQMQEFVSAVGSSMDDRRARLGEYVADAEPAWALQALGPVPGDPAAREAWQERAADVAAYQEAYSLTDPLDPIGPEPGPETPQRRVRWHAAFAALGPGGGVDVRQLPDRSLLHMSATYEAETRWAPHHVAEELRGIRLAASDAEQMITRAAAEAEAARKGGREDAAGRHEKLASSARAMADWYRGTEAELDRHMQVRREWERATEHQRHLAVAADAEYRRRRPEEKLPPLRSAEPPSATEEERSQISPAAEQLEAGYERPAWMDRLAEARRAAEAEIAERRSIQVPSEDPEGDYDGAAWPEYVRQRDAVLQPPKPEIRPSQAVLEAQPAAGPEREA